MNEVTSKPEMAEEPLKEIIRGGIEVSGQTVTEPKLKIWMLALERFKPGAVQEAFSRHYMRTDEAPTIRSICTMLGAKGVDRLIVAFASERGTTIEDLRGPDRHRPLVHHRQDCMRFLRDNTDLSLPQIGRALGGRDHTTIMFGIKASKRREWREIQ